MKWELMFFCGGMIAIPIGSLVPLNWLPPLPNDKLLHFLAFSSMSVLAGRIVKNDVELGIWLIALWIIGGIIECLQNLVPGRKFCWRDMGANAAGILVGTIGYRFVSAYLL